MRTAMQLMLWYLENEGLEESGAYYKAKMLIEKEKEQIIELPSDEEIDKYIEKTFYGVKKHYFKDGVEFMKELIIKTNKKQIL